MAFGSHLWKLAEQIARLIQGPQKGPVGDAGATMQATPSFSDEACDIAGWTIGGMFALGPIYAVIAGAPVWPPMFPIAFVLGLSILPPVVDVLRMAIPIWRWKFVPPTVFVLGLVALMIWLSLWSVSSRGERYPPFTIDWDALDADR